MKNNKLFNLGDLYLVEVDLSNIHNVSDILFYSDCYQNEMCFALKVKDDNYKILSTGQTLSTKVKDNYPNIVESSICKCKNNGREYSLAKLMHKEVLINLNIVKIEDVIEKNNLKEEAEEDLEK